MRACLTPFSGLVTTLTPCPPEEEVEDLLFPISLSKLRWKLPGLCSPALHPAAPLIGLRELVGLPRKQRPLRIQERSIWFSMSVSSQDDGVHDQPHLPDVGPVQLSNPRPVRTRLPALWPFSTRSHRSVSGQREVLREQTEQLSCFTGQTL